MRSTFSCFHRVFALTAVLACFSPLSATAPAAELGIAASHRYLTLNGKPFFWLGDTVWLLAQLPSNADLDLYLETRKKQGFTVIQFTAVMGEERVWGTRRATARGDVPFVDGDVGRPAVTPGNDPKDAEAYDYWDHFDHVLDRVHAHGFRAAVVTYFVGWQGEGYKYLTPEKAHGYGKFLGNRCKSKPEIIWILGGDNTPDTPAKKAVWNAVAKGIVEGLSGREDYAQALMTYHINGGSSSSQFWHQAPWLDFNMAQTWSQYADIYPMLRRDYAKNPPKPCGLGEGAYEDGPQYPTKPIDARVIRKQACWSYFAGGYHTYGNGNVWHFDSLQAESTEPWKQALHSAGADSLRHVRQFLEEVEWWHCLPDPDLITEGQGKADRSNVALRHPNSHALAVYLAEPNPIKLLRPKAAPQQFQGRWVNPATGEKQSIPAFSDFSRPFSPPPGWRDAFLHLTPQK